MEYILIRQSLFVRINRSDELSVVDGNFYLILWSPYMISRNIAVKNKLAVLRALPTESKQLHVA